ncbi:ADP-glucose pyrophosphorylase, conserved site-containing protein [Cynara cardunculus var. scolymus]|uniref:glucose-1-phosphate adenylyltransferase n=1 Tax=Cynara cardunculus var. scolymus TaxID=59895 RepID=A0A103XYS1_CYNCS|nr:ADP-glucose pyrophosphorylase, conserved site-containing protein [Cynara cardunculus var. scolymus]
MDSCCATLNPNVHVRKGVDCIENGFWGRKIDRVGSHRTTQSRKMKKVGVVHSVLKSPIDEMLTFETPFFDERTVDPKTVASIILGGGAGTRLFPLTRKRAKPAVPIGGGYRLIDVPMSNCINSGVRKIFILTQFNSFSLNRHLARTYNFGNGMSFGNGFVEVLAATQTPGVAGKKWFQGTADAVRQFIWVFEVIAYFLDRFHDTFMDAKTKNVENILILSGDHLYRMDYMDFVQKHVDTNADITVSCIPMDNRYVLSLELISLVLLCSRASDYGLMKIDETGRIVHFAEKPKGDLLKSMQVDTRVLGLSDDEALRNPYIASMGVYVFRTDVLLKLLRWKYPSCNDFGSEIIPSAVAEHNVQAYLFNDYWEDIGTIRSFFDANLALTEQLTMCRFSHGQPPKFDFNDPKTPFFTSPRFLPPTKVERCRIVDAIISHGCFLRDCSVQHSVVGIRSRLDQGVQIKDTMMMGADYYQTDSEVAALIANGRVPIVIANKDGVEEADRSDDGFYIRSGITVILKNATIKDGIII